MEVNILGVNLNFSAMAALLDGKYVRTEIELIEKEGKYGKFRIAQLDGQDTKDEKTTTITLIYGFEEDEAVLEVISIDVKSHRASAVGLLQEIGS